MIRNKNCGVNFVFYDYYILSLKQETKNDLEKVIIVF